MLHFEWSATGWATARTSFSLSCSNGIYKTPLKTLSRTAESCKPESFLRACKENEIDDTAGPFTRFPFPEEKHMIMHKLKMAMQKVCAVKYCSLSAPVGKHELRRGEIFVRALYWCWQAPVQHCQVKEGRYLGLLHSIY